MAVVLLVEFSLLKVGMTSLPGVELLGVTLGELGVTLGELLGVTLGELLSVVLLVDQVLLVSF